MVHKLFPCLDLPRCYTISNIVSYWYVIYFILSTSLLYSAKEIFFLLSLRESLNCQYIFSHGGFIRNKTIYFILLIYARCVDRKDTQTKSHVQFILGGDLDAFVMSVSKCLGPLK